VSFEKLLGVGVGGARVAARRGGCGGHSVGACGAGLAGSTCDVDDTGSTGWVRLQSGQQQAIEEHWGQVVGLQGHLEGLGFRVLGLGFRV